MHRKFREKIALDELLNEVEEKAIQMEDMQRSATLLYEYCKDHQDIPEINNMLHLTDIFRLDLMCLSKELLNIIKKEKYHAPDFLDSIGNGFNPNEIVFVDD